MGRKKGGIPWNKGLREENPVDRFFAFVEKHENGCWLWKGFLNHGGYGRFWYEGRNWQAHRWAYERFRGSIPSYLQPDHLCRTPACVNPEHLELVTPRVNTLRGDTITARNAAREECIVGHPLAGDNLYMTPDGRRQCRTCGQRRNAEAAARRRGD